MLNGKKIVVGITGGIAAYKAADLVSRLVKRGVQVRAIMSVNATKFISPLTIETLSGNRAYVDQFSREFEMEHIALAKWADLFVVAPATANFIGKVAGGIADDLITTTAITVTCPTLLAPAMNNNMWKSAACQENVATLIARGVKTVGPGCGMLACGDDDVGRMAEPAEIVEEIARILGRAQDFENKRVLVTAGPTIERIDPVRYLTNRSSGKMGYALAEAARDRGAAVTLVSGPVKLPAPAGVELVLIESTSQLHEQVLALGAQADVVIQAAAPSDFTPAQFSQSKIKKQGDGGIALSLKQTPDIAAALGKTKRAGQVFVVFAAETENLIENARAKMVKKNADMVVANDVTEPGAGFDADTNRITILTGDAADALAIMSKRDAADAILDRVARQF
ncbi:MAG: bifunctional phosphopantothenoylcysteine decarboxylase/phosphopantothenate--cysteine ligase CoaBC [Christensenellales bacterium]|jgi:phosphopantothenoylcysteine decarboxylase/phosphopantothenate--cysteine ligase